MYADSSLEADIRIGVSSCLLGEHVRYDGGHKHDRYITDTLGRFCCFLPVCPETGCGLPVPREAMHLEGDFATPRLVTRRTRIDLTGQMLSFCSVKVKELEEEDLCGFIFKKDSPGCGLFRVKIYNNDDAAVKNGSGLFAAAVARHFPLLPMEEEGRLNNPHLRENFIERVFSYRRWKDFLATEPTFGRLVEFHTTHKLLLKAHSPIVCRTMGALVSNGKDLPLLELLRQYEIQFMKGMSLLATTKKNTNVMQHMMGYFKKHLSSAEKAELLEVIGQYHDNLTQLVVPLTLLRHYVHKYDQQYLNGQVYLSPHPAELMLRNYCVILHSEQRS
ncbi:MAG: DUF523 and DUF1722 domain-containing protein [Desulfuromonadales bacterium]